MAGFTWLARLSESLLLKFQAHVDVFVSRTIVPFNTVHEGHVVRFTSIFLRFTEAVTLKTCCYYEPHKHKVVHSLFLQRIVVRTCLFRQLKQQIEQSPFFFHRNIQKGT